jgi:hypothetical protein
MMIYPPEVFISALNLRARNQQGGEELRGREALVRI